jgi:hypothetical protein
MVDTIKCDHCGVEARRVITKEFDGKMLNFCCKGCLGVFEMLREDGLSFSGTEAAKTAPQK